MPERVFNQYLGHFDQIISADEVMSCCWHSAEANHEQPMYMYDQRKERPLSTRPLIIPKL